MLLNSICSYGTFATGGCDGFVNVWDGNNKKRLYQVKRLRSKCCFTTFELEKMQNNNFGMHLFSSIQNTLLALLHYPLAEMVACWPWHQVTHLKREKNRKNEYPPPTTPPPKTKKTYSPLSIFLCPF